MIREPLVNDAALFVGWKMRGVLRTRPVARRCHHLDKGSVHEPRENRFQQRPPASGPGFRVDRQRDRIRREFDGAKHDGAVVHRRAEGLGIGRVSLCELPVQRLLLDQFQKASLSFRRGGKSSSAARIAGGFEFETS